jgi:hypothetical protein
MSRREWPPGEVAAEPFLARPAPSPSPAPAPAKKQKPAQTQCRGTGRQCCCNTPPPRWRYADDWCDVFHRGFIDGLTRICRAVDDPVVWAAAHTLSARGGDD